MLRLLLDIARTILLCQTLRRWLNLLALRRALIGVAMKRAGRRHAPLLPLYRPDLGRGCRHGEIRLTDGNWSMTTRLIRRCEGIALQGARRGLDPFVGKQFVLRLSLLGPFRLVGIRDVRLWHLAFPPRRRVYVGRAALVLDAPLVQLKVRLHGDASWDDRATLHSSAA